MTETMQTTGIRLTNADGRNSKAHVEAGDSALSRYGNVSTGLIAQ